MQTLAIAGGIAAILGHLVWIRGILNGTMHLNLATWVMWALIDACILAASIYAGAPAPYLPMGFLVGATLVALALLFKGTWGWGFLETACTAIAAVSLIGWYFGGPLTALVLLTIGKYTAGIPSVVRGYQVPERKQSWMWFVNAFGAAANIFAGGTWTLAQSLFPTFAFAFSALTGFVHLRQKKVFSI
ncbi:MAG: hypothetical protein Q7S01_00870 [bacterium]|nr:hypothetical protein [bacterium]